MKLLLLAKLRPYLMSPSSRGRGLKSLCFKYFVLYNMSPSSRGRGLKLRQQGHSLCENPSPSSRGRGLKLAPPSAARRYCQVALFTRAWIEIDCQRNPDSDRSVALFTRAWIEIAISYSDYSAESVALFTRAWIEIKTKTIYRVQVGGRPLHEGVD